MATGSKAVSKKQPIVIDPESFKDSLSSFSGEVEQIKNCGIMIYDEDSFNEAAANGLKAKKIREKIEETFKPVSESLKAATKTLKASTEAFTEPLQKYEDAAREQCKKFLEENRTLSPDNGRLQGGKWKLNVKDEDALFRSMITATLKRNKEGTYIDIQLDPKIRALFVYNEAKGNALASAITNTLSIPGCEIKQNEVFVFTAEVE